MKLLQWKELALKDAQGNRVTRFSDQASLTVRTEPVARNACRGYVCRVTLTCAAGLDGAESAFLVPVLEDACRYLAIYNHSFPWCRPFWGEYLHELPACTQELLIEREGKYLCILPVCDDTVKTVIRGGEDGMEFLISTNMSGMTGCRDQLSFVCMEGSDPAVLLRAVAAEAAEQLGNGLRMREQRPYPEVLEYLGWCSWDAFWIHVNHWGLLQKAEEFRKKQVPVHYAIIDDMWADIPALNTIPQNISLYDTCKVMHASKLKRFEGDPVRFPEGMKKTVSDLKDAGIPEVGIWFPTTGYWSGLDPEGEEAQELADVLITTGDGQRLPSPEPEQAKRYFDRLCDKIRSWGADFVKIDNQGFYRHYCGIAPIGRSAGAVQEAIDRAAETHFGGAIINCMGMPNECMFHRTHSAVCRCSDDFMPESREWFAKNILQCAYNGLLQGQYQVNDWDMWWTDDEQAVKNSVCRAISGGPVYVSDKLERTRPEVLRPLTLSNGRLLRCDESACPTADCLMRNPTEGDRVFKIRNRAGESGLVAVFNISAANQPVKGSVSPLDCGMPDTACAWYEYFTQTAGILPPGGSMEISLSDNDDFRLFTFVPMPEDGAAVLGRTDLFIGIRAATRNGNTVALAEGGPVGFVSRQPIRVFGGDGEVLPVTRRGMLTVADVPRKETCLRLGF